MRADQVRSEEFKQCLRGYDVDEVDSFLDRVAVELESGRSVRALCATPAFRRALRGYNTEDVDRFVRKVAAEDQTFGSAWDHYTPPSLPSASDRGNPVSAPGRRRTWGRTGFSASGTLAILGFSVVCLGVAGLGIGLFVSNQIGNARFARDGVVIHAKVVDRSHDNEGEDGTFDYLYVHIPACDCRVRLGTTNLAGHPVGSVIPVRYDPKNPEDARPLVDGNDGWVADIPGAVVIGFLLYLWVGLVFAGPLGRLKVRLVRAGIIEDKAAKLAAAEAAKAATQDSQAAQGDGSPVQPPPDTPKVRGRAWRAIWQSWWLLLAVTGLTTWLMFVYLGARTHRRRYYLWAAVFLVAILVGLGMSGSSDKGTSANAIGTWIFSVAWLSGIIAGVKIRASGPPRATKTAIA